MRGAHVAAQYNRKVVVVDKQIPDRHCIDKLIF